MVETLRQTAFMCGRLTRAGEMGWRARWGLRGCRRTCIRVAEGWGVVVKGRGRGWVESVVGVVVVVVGLGR